MDNKSRMHWQVEHQEVVAEGVVDIHASGVQKTQDLLGVSSKLEALGSSVLELDERDACAGGVDDDSFVKILHGVVVHLVVEEHVYRYYLKVVDESSRVREVCTVPHSLQMVAVKKKLQQ